MSKLIIAMAAVAAVVATGLTFMRTRMSSRSKWAPLVRFAGAGLLAATVLAAAAGSAGAAVTPVNCAPFGTDDLQAALNAAAPGDTLSIKGTCTGNFTASQNVTLQRAAPGATLNGGGTGRTLTIFGPATVTVTGLIVTGGVAERGAGITASGATVNVVNATVRGNTATQGNGGGIRVRDSSTLNVTGSTISDNTATSDGANGGGIYGRQSTLNVTDSTVSGNSTGNGGGGIASEVGSTLTVTGSTVSWNTAFGAGGGVGGGISNGGGSVSLINSTVDHNTSGSGGGIWNDSADTDATLTIDHSSVSFNRALATPDDYPFNGGGGIFNFAEAGNTASLVATHLTMTGNLARTANGGAIHNLEFTATAATVTLAQSFIGPASGTLNGNQALLGGGIYNEACCGPGGPATVSLQAGTIIAHNQATIDGGGVYNDASGNLLIAPGVVFLFNSPDNVSDESPGGNS
jgi:parallel beta-helix repeat protein